jgi:hypothetical protein
LATDTSELEGRLWLAEVEWAPRLLRSHSSRSFDLPP